LLRRATGGAVLADEDAPRSIVLEESLSASRLGSPAASLSAGSPSASRCRLGFAIAFTLVL
jgi:hypothetical protein